MLLQQLLFKSGCVQHMLLHNGLPLTSLAACVSSSCINTHCLQQVPHSNTMTCCTHVLLICSDPSILILSYYLQYVLCYVKRFTHQITLRQAQPTSNAAFAT
jgi:hypothetical protein